MKIISFRSGCANVFWYRKVRHPGIYTVEYVGSPYTGIDEQIEAIQALGPEKRLALALRLGSALWHLQDGLFAQGYKLGNDTMSKSFFSIYTIRKTRLRLSISVL